MEAGSLRSHRSSWMKRLVQSLWMRSFLTDPVIEVTGIVTGAMADAPFTRTEADVAFTDINTVFMGCYRSEGAGKEL